MGKTIRRIKKSNRKSKRKSVRKGKRSIRRKSYKKMRGGGLNEELDAFVKNAALSKEEHLSKEDINSIIDKLGLNELKDKRVDFLMNKLENRKYIYKDYRENRDFYGINKRFETVLKKINEDYEKVKNKINKAWMEEPDDPDENKYQLYGLVGRPHPSTYKNN
jgi:hypothetical protein